MEGCCVDKMLTVAYWTARPTRPLMLAGLMGVGLSVSAVVLEHGFNVLPCPMCWWQRYLHWAIAAAAGLGLMAAGRPQAVRGAAALVVAFSAAGFGIALWQFAAQHGWLPFPASCTGGDEVLAQGADLLAAMQTTVIIPCDRENFKLLGLSLAGWNLPAMLATGVLGLLALRRR